jgi:hypothetical protein
MARARNPLLGAWIAFIRVVPTARHTCALGQLTEKIQGSFLDETLTAGGTDHFRCVSTATSGPNALVTESVGDAEPMNWPTATHESLAKQEIAFKVLVAVGLDVSGPGTRAHFLPVSVASETPSAGEDVPTAVQKWLDPQDTPESSDV